MNNSVKNGLLAGLIAIALYLVMYFVSPKIVVGQALNWVSLIIPIAFMVMAGISERNANGGSLSFGEALKTCFITFLIYSVLFYIFSYVLFNFIGTDLAQLEMDAAREQVEKITEMMGGGDATDEMMEAMEDQNLHSIGNTAFSLVMSLIGGFILSLIIGAIVKRDS